MRAHRADCFPASLLAGLVFVAPGGCGDSSNLPPVQASSAHFRYHARSPEDVQSDILERLERNRADFYQFTGLTDESVTDYYYFTDDKDLAATGPCTLASSDCALGHSAYASIPFHEHELIHTYMAGGGAPSAPVLEGLAESIGCIRSGTADASRSETDWRRAVHDYPSADLTLYAGDQRFVTSLIARMGVAETMGYYRFDPFTLDPTAFASSFERFWTAQIDGVWSAAVGSGAPGPFVPICPCSQDPITTQAGTTMLAHPNDAEYRPLLPGSGPLTLEFSSNGYVALQNCTRDTPSVQVLQQSLASRSTMVLQPDQDHYFLTFENPATEVFTASSDLALQPTCSGLSIVDVVTRAPQLGLAAPRSGGGDWYIGISAAPSMAVQRTDGGSGAVAICSDCTLTSCHPVGALGTTATVGDGTVVRFTPDSSASTKGLDAVSLSFF